MGRIKLIHGASEAMSANAFGTDGALTIQRIVDNGSAMYVKHADELADLIRRYASHNRACIPEGIEAFREYQLAILQRLHGISPEVARRAEELILKWN